MSRIIGIDLGTSTSEAAVFMDGKPQMIPNKEGDYITPSVVGTGEAGEFLVGKKAEGRYLLYPHDTAIEIKRKIGRGENIPLGDHDYTPVELSAQILIYLKEAAEAYLGETVDRAVITVPAYFNNQQRQETMEAGQKAGLLVERIINEPTAAALCYGVDHMEEESHVLVYDFGGGTFDVTLLEMFDGVLEVKASSGDNQLGGKDFDEAVINYLLEKCQEQYQVDLRQDVYAMVKLKEEAVKCKIALSAQPQYEILLPMIFQKGETIVSIDEVITKELFESLIQELVSRTSGPVHTVLRDGRINASQIDRILMVGGSTRVPYVKQYVEKLLGKVPEELVDPDLAVVMGASIQGGMIGHEIDEETGIMMTDVAPYPLGIRIARDEGFFTTNDYMDILIPRNVTIPVTKRRRYETCTNYQRETNIDVYQGEEKKATSNYCLGKFVLAGIPAKRAGEEKIDVEFSYDLNGILNVEAQIVSTGKSANITIETVGIEIQEAKQKKVVDLTQWKQSPLAKKFRSTIRKAEKLEVSGDIMEEEDQEMLTELLEELKFGLIQGDDEEELAEIEEELIDLIDDLEE